MTNIYSTQIIKAIKATIPKDYTADYIITLGSASPRRKELLLKLEKNIVIKPVSYNEAFDKNWPLSETSLILALNKAKQFFERVNHISSRFLITADTIVYHKCPDVILGKPKTINDAKKMLMSHLGKTHTVSSAFVLVDILKNQLYTGLDHCEISFFPQNTKLLALIDEYTKTKPPSGPMDKAGAYGYQEDIIKDNFIKDIKGDPTTIIGFPLEKFIMLWKSL